MTADGVEQGGHAEAEDGADKEEQENELLREGDIVMTLVTQRLDVKYYSHYDERNEA